jgi:hypothetical protein
LIVFAYDVVAVYDGIRGSIHDGRKTTLMSKIRAVEKKVFDRDGIIAELWWWLVEPVIFNALDNFVIVVTQSNELFQSIPFTDPQLKPASLIIVSVPHVMKSIRMSTIEASISLDIGMGFPIANDVRRVAMRTGFFS